jgi:hypothetical protein
VYERLESWLDDRLLPIQVLNLYIDRLRYYLQFGVQVRPTGTAEGLSVCPIVDVRHKKDLWLMGRDDSKAGTGYRDREVKALPDHF